MGTAKIVWHADDQAATNICNRYKFTVTGTEAGKKKLERRTKGT